MVRLIKIHEQIEHLAQAVAQDVCQLGKADITEELRTELVHNIRIRRERIKELQKLAAAN